MSTPNESAQGEAPAKAEATKAPRNLTREAVATFIKAKAIDAGKPEPEAAKFAAKRAAEMVA